MKVFSVAVASVALAVGVSSALGGCSTSSSSGGGVSCVLPDMSECMTVPAGTMCTSGKTSVSGGCPSSGQLGCCAITGTASNGQTTTVTTCSYCAGMNNPSASASMYSKACSAEGPSAKWTPGDMTSCGDGGSSSGADAGGTGIDAAAD